MERRSGTRRRRKQQAPHRFVKPTQDQDAVKPFELGGACRRWPGERSPDAHHVRLNARTELDGGIRRVQERAELGGGRSGSRRWTDLGEHRLREEILGRVARCKRIRLGGERHEFVPIGEEV